MSLLKKTDVGVQSLAPKAAVLLGSGCRMRHYKKDIHLLLLLKSRDTGKMAHNVTRGITIFCFRANPNSYSNRHRKEAREDRYLDSGISAGMYAFINFLSTLIQCVKDGRGCLINISM